MTMNSTIAATRAVSDQEKNDAPNFEQINYALNKTRPAVSHAGAFIADLEMRKSELQEERKRLEDRARRVMNEIADLDATIAAINHAIDNLQNLKRAAL